MQYNFYNIYYYIKFEQPKIKFYFLSNNSYYDILNNYIRFYVNWIGLGKGKYITYFLK